ncbi:MAG: pilus assembly protein, partial [Kineothrix sp.]|nr:pilus assembly protein [Kineothrix sp.]
MEFEKRELKKDGLKGIKCKKAEGYFTVEASLVMPLVIFLIGFIFYLTFYLYNRCAIAQDTYV